MSGLEEKVVWKDFKFCFKIATSEVVRRLFTHLNRDYCDKDVCNVLHLTRILSRQQITLKL